jgi:hypothetical protein
VTNLPDEHHVIRHVPWTKLRRDEDDNVIGILPHALVRDKDHDSLSVNWIEYHDGDWATQMCESVWAIRRTRPSIGGRGKSRYAIGSISEIKRVCLSGGVRIRIIHEPIKDNPAHSGIRRLPNDDLTLLAALADDVFTDTVNNAAIPSESPKPTVA